jgi:hypothetical protein
MHCIALHCIACSAQPGCACRMVQRMLGYSPAAALARMPVGRSAMQRSAQSARSARPPALCAVLSLQFLSVHRILRAYANHVGTVGTVCTVGIGLYAIRAAQSAELSDGVPVVSQRCAQGLRDIGQKAVGSMSEHELDNLFNTAQCARRMRWRPQLLRPLGHSAQAIQCIQCAVL